MQRVRHEHLSAHTKRTCTDLVQGFYIGEVENLFRFFGIKGCFCKSTPCIFPYANTRCAMRTVSMASAA